MHLEFLVWLSTLAVGILAKNVVNLPDSNGDIDGNDKRDPKNVINLDEFLEQLQDKREPKNVIDLQTLADAIEQEQQKRDAKNVVDLEKIEYQVKREAKNVVDLQDLAYAVKEQQMVKRDAKNLINLDELAEAIRQQNQKRKNVVNLPDEDTKVNDKRKNVINLNDFKIGVEQEVNNEKRTPKNVISITDFLNAYNEEAPVKRDIDHQVNFKIDQVDCHENLLQSILPQIRDISIFSGYIRDNQYISTKTEATDEITIIIAPSDDAIIHKLNGKKPWEFPLSTDNDKNVEKNCQNFLFGHIVENFEDNLQIEQQTVLTQLLNGNFLSIKQDITNKFSIKVNMDDWIDVKQVKQVDNGFIFVIDDVLVKPQN